MSTPNLFIQLQAILAVSKQLNQIPPYIVTYDFGNPQQSATAELFEPYFQATTGGVVVPLTAATIFTAFVQNLHATALLRVTVTPTGQSAQPYTLGPGGMWIYFDPLETGGGITALTLTGIVSTVPAAVLVGG